MQLYVMFYFNPQTLSFSVDHCQDSAVDPLATFFPFAQSKPLANCPASAYFPVKDGPLGWGTPVKMGQFGLHHRVSGSSIQARPFQGCISNININKEVLLKCFSVQ